MEGLLCLEESSVVRHAFKHKDMLFDDRLLHNMLTKEDQYMPSPTYFLFQLDIKLYMRKIVTSWMLEVCEEQQREEEVFTLSVNLMDRYLSSTQVKKSQLQLLASTCMFIASKMMEMAPLEASKLVIYTDHSITVDELLEWEMLVLQVLKYDIAAITAHDFVDLLIARLPIEPTQHEPVKRHAQTFIALCATDFGFVRHPPSLIAASSISAAASGLLGQPTCLKIKLVKKLHKITSIDSDCIEACQEQIEQALAASVISESSDGELSNQSDSLPSTSNQKLCTPGIPTTPTDIREIYLHQ